MVRKGLFAGTFDPPTVGHMDIIDRAAQLCSERLYIAIAKNSGKDSFFSLEERLAFLRTLTSSYRNVEVLSFSGLVVDCAKALEVDVLVRGVRGCVDLDYEMQMASANRQMTGIETLVLLPSIGFGHISGTLIREIATCGRRLHGFVPDVIEEVVSAKLQQASFSQSQSQSQS